MQITNKTKQPLTVRLPEAFAGVPVLAQCNSNNNNNQNQNQGTGGGFGGGGGGWFLAAAAVVAARVAASSMVPAEKMAQLKVATVCLEHGKKPPRAGIAYEIKPIESFTGKAEVQELCKLMGQGHYSSQRAAQAATFGHLANGMSWGAIGLEANRAPQRPERALLQRRRNPRSHADFRRCRNRSQEAARQKCQRKTLAERTEVVPASELFNFKRQHRTPLGTFQAGFFFCASLLSILQAASIAG